jgi:exosome complex component CSL4
MNEAINKRFYPGQRIARYQ